MKGTPTDTEINKTNYIKNKNSIDKLNQNENENENENETSENYVENYGNYPVNDYNASVSEKDFYGRINASINVGKDVESGILYDSKLFINNENQILKENNYITSNNRKIRNEDNNNNNNNNMQYNINYSGINNIIVNNKYDNGKKNNSGYELCSKLSLQSNQTEGQASSSNNNRIDGPDDNFHENGSYNSNNYNYSNTENNSIDYDNNNTVGVNPMNMKIKNNENGNMSNTRIPTLNFHGNSNSNGKRLNSHSGHLKNAIPTTV